LDSIGLGGDLESRGNEMARQCDICGKGPQVGNRVETRGKAKYLGGVGTKVTGITRRQFKPNLQKVKVAGPDGGSRSLRVCTQCIRSGAIRKAVKRSPFRLAPTDTKTATS
jgi:large subunit ribosomal protein L28